MRLVIAAVGRLRGSPEQALVDDYTARASATGRPLGLGPVSVVEVDERKQRTPEEQAARLIARTEGCLRLLLDETGEALTSPGLARQIARHRDGGQRALAFLIGGADGHGPAARDAADARLSLGPMVWPHALARVMIAEQVYRSLTILAGSPYHRA